jgi:hypothetical protein
MFYADTVAAIRAVATRLRIDPAALLAVAEVESGGQAFAASTAARSHSSASRGTISTGACRRWTRPMRSQACRRPTLTIANPNAIQSNTYRSAETSAAESARLLKV